MKNLLGIIVLLCSNSLFSQTTNSVVSPLSQLLNDPNLTSARVSFCMVDVNTGEVLLAHEAEKAVIPASLMKVATTITALETLGATQTFTTKLYYSGSIKNGVLEGDLILKGGGDPTLGSEFFGVTPEQVIFNFANSVKNAGIISVKGRLLIDETYFENDVPATWSWEDVGNYYAAPARSLNFVDNRMTLTFTTLAPGTIAKLVSINPVITGLTIESKVKSAEITADNAYCFAAPDALQMFVKGQLPANRSDFKIKAALPQPGIYLGISIANQLKILSIPINGGVELTLSKSEFEKHTLLHQQISPAVAEIVKVTNGRSINLFAEALMKHIARQSGKEFSQETEAIQSFWIDKLKSQQGLQIKDGSGLSHYNTITAKQLCEMLVFAGKSKSSMAFKASLPVAGNSGTLSNFGKSTVLDNNFLAKSGYMTGSRGYAGYTKLKSGKEVALVLIVNNYDLSAGAMKKKMENLLVTLVNEY
jgi:serine-type D-Ala-D-Ala carboxypeptidase/endopeptidase (penicillin-binding protein 4)